MASEAAKMAVKDNMHIMHLDHRVIEVANFKSKVKFDLPWLQWCPDFNVAFIL